MQSCWQSPDGQLLMKSATLGPMPVGADLTLVPEQLIICRARSSWRFDRGGVAEL